ncbi:MAG: leucine-rich repeat domain-containing protein [Clostridiales bacterium]|nr:leucine-rich repeat domain-containing protein [Clostridiales bacterium]
MSSFNTVTKIKYTDKSSDPVTLNEYIVFEDDKSSRKYIVFRFNNNVTQQLLGMRFEVCQYNAAGDLIEKSVVVYNEFLAGAEEEFVPKAKLRVSFKCTSVSVRLIQAAFDRFVWNEGEFEDNTYKFGMFYSDETRPKEEDAAKSKRAKKINEPKVKPEKYKKSKYPFVMKDVTSRNLTKFPLVFNVLIIILSLAFVFVTLYMFKKDTKKFTEGSYLLRIYDGGVAVYGYTGDASNLVIPEELGSYKVTKIDSGAFKNSKISTVTFSGVITVDTGAFTNCKNLTGVYTNYSITLLSGAFNGCPVRDFRHPSGSYIPDDAFLNLIN